MYKPRPKSVDYVEMPSTDLAQTKRFFSALFGWSFQDYGPDYIAFEDGRLAGGFFAAEEVWPNTGACPLVVFFVPALQGARAEATRLGAEITRDIFEFPGGWRFHFRAPGSGEFAIWSDKQPKG